MTLLLALPGIPEMTIILFAIILLFGGKKIPGLMRGIGQGISEFRRAKKDIEDSLNDGMKMIDK